jgi:hypothetical protein
MFVLDEMTAETLNIFKSATSGFTSSTGVAGIDLSDLISLIPVPTDFRDELARTHPDMGAVEAQWEVLLNVNNQQPKASVAYDAAGPLALIESIPMSAPFQPLAMGYTVTRDAIAKARGYANAQAIAIYNAINQFKIAEDKLAMGGQAFPLQQPAAPTCTTAATGGSIAPSTEVYIGVAARTVSGYYYCNGDGLGEGHGNSQGNSGNVTTSTVTGSTHTVSGSTTSVAGAACYDWFQSSTGSAPWYYYTTTTIPAVTMTTVITANQAPPTNPEVAGGLPDLSTTTPTYLSTGDNGSAGTGASPEFNGLLASITGDYLNGGISTHGSGTSSGATLIDAAGSAFSAYGGGIEQLDQLNATYYNQTKLQPSMYMVSAQESNSLSALVLDSPSAVTYLTMNDAAGRAEVVAGGRVGSYVSRINGAQIPIRLYPNMPPGTLIARRDSVPYPNADINRVLEMRCIDDLYQFQYGADRAHGGPREDGETRAVETLINRAPVVFGAIQSLAPAAE